jgi:hypothetical protein
LSGRGLCDGLITRLEESYRLARRMCHLEHLVNEEAIAREWAAAPHKKNNSTTKTTAVVLLTVSSSKQCLYPQRIKTANLYDALCGNRWGVQIRLCDKWYSGRWNVCKQLKNKQIEQLDPCLISGALNRTGGRSVFVKRTYFCLRTILSHCESKSTNSRFIH